jgi:hypothetical protein
MDSTKFKIEAKKILILVYLQGKRTQFWSLSLNTQLSV